MTVVSIRDVGDELKSQLKREADAEGRSLSDLARTLITEGLEQRRRQREQQEWIRETQAAREFEAAQIDKHGMLLDTIRPPFPITEE